MTVIEKDAITFSAFDGHYGSAALGPRHYISNLSRETVPIVPSKKFDFVVCHSLRCASFVFFNVIEARNTVAKVLDRSRANRGDFSALFSTAKACPAIVIAAPFVYRAAV